MWYVFHFAGYLDIVSSDDGNANEKREESDIIVPSVGMKFKDENEVFEFYKKYAYQLGFPVRKRNSKKGDDGIVCYVTFTCSRGDRQASSLSSYLKPQPTIKIGCKARLTAC